MSWHSYYNDSELDRKSSRGMIYENEELRLRTININAEVERGQSDIKRLRRENEQLRREIWSLRDECDRLNKRFKANHGSCNARCSGGSSGGGHHHRRSGGGHSGGHSNSNTDDSDSCDTCRGDDQCSDECCTDSGCRQSAAALQKQQLAAEDYDDRNDGDDVDGDVDVHESNVGDGTTANNGGSSILHNAFDHLSVVSEETLSNSELQVPLSDGSYLGSSYTSDLNSSQMTIPSFGPLTPLTPIELVANQLNDLQAVVPPLSYFENIVHQNHMGSTIGTTPETAAIGGPHKISRHTNGWDYNMQSPFAHLNSHGNTGAYQTNSSNSASSSTATNSTVIQSAQKFSTFVPATSVTPPTATNTPDAAVSNIKQMPFLNTFNTTTNNTTATTTTNNHNSTSASPPSASTSSNLIETVAITTMPQQRPVSGATQPLFGGVKAISTTAHTSSSVNTPASAASAPLSSPKHFFSPLKPRLKLNTTLANHKNLTMATAVVAMAPMGAPPIPVRPPVAPTLHQNCEPPDIFVANALASPYHRQPVPTIRVGPALVTKPSSSPPPPPTQSSSTISPHHQAKSMNSSLQVSPRHRHHQHHHSKAHSRDQSPHQHHHHHRQHHQNRRSPTNPTIIVNLVDDLNDDVGNDDWDKDLISIDRTETELSEVSPKHLSLPKREMPSAAYPPLTQTSGGEAQPIYAIAQNTLQQLISATALTQPLMATSTAALHLPTNLRTGTSGAVLIKTPTPSQLTTPITTPISSPRRQILVRQRMKVSSQSMMVDLHDQTDSVNLEAILNDIETISEDILAIQLDKNRSRDNLPTVGVAADCRSKPLQQQDKTKKPYRSEMNLLLSYEGANPTITPALKVTSAAADPTTATIQRRRTRSLEGGDHTDSPSSMPDPMAPFPDNHTYIGFEHLNSAVGTTQTTTSLSAPITVPYSSARPPIPPAPSIPSNGVGGFVNPRPAIPPKPMAPAPPARTYPAPLNIRCAGVAKSPTSASFDKIAPGLSPNKSQLYASLANAAAKRALFRSAPTHLARSLDDSETGGEQSGTDKDETGANTEQLSPASEAAKKKAARRVSILCTENGGVILTSPVASSAATTTAGTTPAEPRFSSPSSAGATATSGITTTTMTTATNAPLTSGSYSDLPSMNPTLKYLKQMQSHSTPSSPHSVRRRANSNSMEPTKFATPSGQHNSLPPGQTPTTQSALAMHQQQQQQPRKSSQDSTRELAAAAAIVARSRCSRRHSDGTVAGAANAVQQQRHSGGGHHHQHHHHHQMGHGNPHHSHHSRQDSNHETGTSLSDRNSNSLASSRESSTSFSMRSQRRKISVSSHTGGKIPWCGCWGNGCL